MHSGIDLIRHYFPHLTPAQTDRFEKLLPLYSEWNEKINVISRPDIQHLYERHVLHSLSISKVVSFAHGSKVIDAGTGGGFPGIPLAIIFPEISFHLVDSIGKKIRVVSEVASALKLTNVTTQHSRVEEVDDVFDFAVSRAVAPLAEMISWLNPIIRAGNKSTLPNGMLFLKGGALEEEIRNAKQKVSVVELKNYFTEEFFAEKKVLFVPVQHAAKR